MTGDRILAASTTRPVSAGKFAAAKAAPIHSAAMRSGARARAARAEHARRPLAAQNFTFGAACASASAVKGASGFTERKTVVAHSTVGKVLSAVLKSCDRRDVVPAGDRDAVLGALELRLQGEEVLVRLEVGIVLADGEQAPERAGKLRPAPAASP